MIIRNRRLLIKKKYLVFTLIIFLIIGLNFKCKSNFEPNHDNDHGNKYPTGEAGEWVESCYYSLLVESVFKSISPIGTKYPPEGNCYLLIRVIVKNIGVEDQENPFISWNDFGITSSQGNSYKQSDDLYLLRNLGLDDFVPGSDLDLGQTREGKLAIEIAESDTGLVLHFKTFYQKDSEIKVSLGV